MPLVRAEVRNEYALGNPELYRAAARREDPKGVLDGVAVSGLVGILRQLGDLAGFASEIFHDLHEQVVATSARGHRMVARVQRIEIALPQIEKAIQVQKSHIHFAYLPGSDWHTNTHVEHEQLLSSDLPRFIMDSYEECREPPRLFLLDKFDRAGPGACLKRYSDPTYFKRVHASSEKLHHEKTQKERKVHKIKRKSSRMLNRERQHAILLSCQTNSIPCASPGSDVQSVAGETVSSSDMRLKSDLGSRSPSFDSRTRASYEEPVSNTNSTAEARGAMFGEPCASRLKIEDSDECASLAAYECNSSADGDSFHNSLQEQRDLRSPSVTWDEKTEIFKPNSPQACDDDIVESKASPESSTVVPDQGVKEQGINNSVQSVQDDISICVPSVPHQEEKRVAENLSVSVPGVSHYEEVTSETDNYVDALNTMESETDTDSEFQTKHEVKAIKASSIHTCQIENGPDNKNPDYSNSVPDDNSRISESLQHKETTPGISNLFPVKGRNCADPLPISGLTSDEVVSAAGHDLTEIEENSSLETSKENETTHPPSAESDIQDMQAQSSGNPPNVLEDKNVVDTHNTTENCASSDLTHVKIWTNGGLLGVKPSKPQYFAAQSTASQNSTPSMNDGGDEPICGSTANHEAETTLIGSSSVVGTSGDHRSSDSISWHMGSNQRRAKSEVQPVCPFKPSLSRNGYSDGSMSFRESIPDYSKIKHGKFQKSQSTNLGGCNWVVSNSIGNGTPQCSAERLSVGLAETSLPSNLQKEALISHDERQGSFERSTYSTVPMKERSFLEDHKQHPRAPAESRLESNGKQGITSRSLSSGPPSPPSPPLEHMKISFHPVNGTMTSQLKLEFPESHLHERIEELMFPSFQLHPGDAASMQHFSSESDDDTFCMSSPYCSEHILSHHSDSDFDTWEQEEIENGNNGMFGASHTVSSLSASIPCASGYYQINHHYVRAENEGNDLKTKEDNIITFQSGNLPDLPYLEALKPTLNNQAQSNLPEENTPPDSKLESTNDEMQSQPAPPPPLPPPQWKITKPLPYLNYGQHGIETSDDLMPLQSQASIKLESKQNTGKPVQPSPPPPQPPVPPVAAYADKAAVRHTKSMSESVKPYTTKRAEQVANVKEPDERDDLLQQIRSRSFNLRRTATMKQSFASGPAANGKVASIIEKANAIRQVVGGSDEGGEDSTWSDS